MFCEETLDLKDSQAYTDQFITGLHSSLVRDLGKRGWQRKRREVRKNILRNPILLSISLICFFCVCVSNFAWYNIIHTYIHGYSKVAFKNIILRYVRARHVVSLHLQI